MIQVLKPKPYTANAEVHFAQQKLNGHRYRFAKVGDTVSFSSRRAEQLLVKYPHMLHTELVKSLIKLTPPNTIIDGELYVPGSPPSSVLTNVLQTPECLKFGMFAMPLYKNNDLTLESCTAVMCLLLNHGFRLTPNINVVHTENIPDNLESVLGYYLQRATQERYEGFVLKYSNYSGWYKIKPQREVDCVVLGVRPGLGKYIGQVGSLRVGAVIDGEMKSLANISGCTDEVRKTWSVNDIGRVCEVEYQAIGSCGGLIHAHFVRWRDDKPSTECVYTQESL